jgi:hypothetical protein
MKFFFFEEKRKGKKNKNRKYGFRGMIHRWNKFFWGGAIINKKKENF